MSAPQEIKPVTTEAGAVEPTPAPAQTFTAETVTAEAVEPKVEEPAKAETTEEATTALPVAAEEKKEENVEEPIYSGALGYKAPGLKNAFRFSKKYFWFGEEEAVSVQSLSHYLRGEKAEVAHPTAAWSSQTGKGLLYFVKHADEKATPAGVLNLSEATDLIKDGTIAFSFKLHGSKHTFEAQNLKERNGWFIAVEKAIAEAKANKENIVSSESYKEELAKLGKPATLAATAATGSAPKKSLDTTPKLAETEAVPAEGSAAPARAGSSSSSSSDEEKKKKAASKSKSRSVSRGKRSSIFGGLLGKKDKAEEKAEEKKEVKAEEKKDDETAAPAPATEASIVAPTAPVIPAVEENHTKPMEEMKDAEETVPTIPAAAPVAAPVAEETKPEEKKVEEKPKPTKRGSIFGSFVEKLKSPTHEKKEHEVAPPVPAKEPETTVEAPRIEEASTPFVAAPVAPVTEESTAAPTEAPKVEETKPVSGTTPRKEKQHFSFGKFLGGGNKEKVRSPSVEKAPEVKTEEPAKTEETPAVTAPTEANAPAAPLDGAVETPKEEQKVETPAATAAATPVSKQKRGSIFGNLLRNASKAGKSSKKEEAPATPAKVDETTEEPAKVKETPATASTEPATIGDVVPEAVTVGQASKSTPQVSASA